MRVSRARGVCCRTGARTRSRSMTSLVDFHACAASARRVIEKVHAPVHQSGCRRVGGMRLKPAPALDARALCLLDARASTHRTTAPVSHLAARDSRRSRAAPLARFGFASRASAWPRCRTARPGRATLFVGSRAPLCGFDGGGPAPTNDRRWGACRAWARAWFVAPRTARVRALHDCVLGQRAEHLLRAVTIAAAAGALESAEFGASRILGGGTS